jgi:membrane-associated phospholipid phosphatase
MRSVEGEPSLLATLQTRQPQLPILAFFLRPASDMEHAMGVELLESAAEAEIIRPTTRCEGRRLSVNLRSWLVPPLALALLAAAALWVDVPVAQWAAGRAYPRAVRELMSLAEAFGHGVGVTVVLLTVFMLDLARRRQLPRSILAVIASGCGANLLKLVIARHRPAATDLLQADAWGTFAGWFPFGHNGSGLQSFPSAHTATAVGLALVLATFYPLGRRLYFVFAAAVAMQRVLGGAHYPSDVLAGAAIGWLCALPVLGFARADQRLTTSSGSPP